MSATADGARLAGLMDAEVIESAGRHVPGHRRARQTRHRRISATCRTPSPAPSAPRWPSTTATSSPSCPAWRKSAAPRPPWTAAAPLVLPLHGDLPPAEQDRALRQPDTPRVVLATSIAETSLTVPGVRIVVDGGWRRAPRLDPSTGLTRLATVRISRAAADQRAGRAGREAPGVAIRVWTPALHRGLPAFDRPEILEAELSRLVLECAAWGTPPAELTFQDPPPAGALAAAAALLKDLGALDDDGADHRRPAGTWPHSARIPGWRP